MCTSKLENEYLNANTTMSSCCIIWPPFSNNAKHKSLKPDAQRTYLCPTLQLYSNRRVSVNSMSDVEVHLAASAGPPGAGGAAPRVLAPDPRSLACAQPADRLVSRPLAPAAPLTE